MRKGRETKICAMTTAVVVKAMSRPAPLSRAPSVERREGREQRYRQRRAVARAAGRRGWAAHAPPRARERISAAGTPRRRSTPRASRQVRSDKLRAAALGRCGVSPSWPS